MKSMFGLLMVLVMALVSGLVYLTVRPKVKQTSDWQRVKQVPKDLRTYFTKLFTSKPAPAVETPAAHAAA